MAANDTLIERFYEAFDRHDGETMAMLYAPDAHFRDPAFGDLTGEEAGDMWRMLTSRAEDLEVELASHSAEGDTGSANWIAYYTFRTGRHVTNDIQARFRFAGRPHRRPRRLLLVSQVGAPGARARGLVLGLPVVRGLVQRKARADLDAYRASKGPAPAA